MSETYELFQQGRNHLAAGRAAQATVALDSRIELFPPAVWADAEALTADTADPLGILRRHDVAIVILARDPSTGAIVDDGTLPQAMLGSGAWIEAYNGLEGRVYQSVAVEP